MARAEQLGLGAWARDTYRKWMRPVDPLEILRTAATVATITAAAMIAANYNARLTVGGFIIFIFASLAWMSDGYFEDKVSLIIQNAILLGINVLGVWRWLPRAEKEAFA